jgi:hypothetical protein
LENLDMASQRWVLLLVAVGLVTALVHASAGPPGVDPTEAATRTHIDAVLTRLIGLSSDWRERHAAAKELAAIGKPAIGAVCRTAASHSDRYVRNECYELLTNEFAAEPQAIQTVIHAGLRDSDEGIRYLCAFSVGEHKIAEAVGPLREVLKTASDGNPKPMLPLYATAKSLAELGQTDGICLLYHALGSDYYLERYPAHRGFLAISGKSPDDFNGYKFGEVASVSGGVEYFDMGIRSVENAEKKACRFLAIVEYCKWLRKNRPDLAKAIDRN